jgi:c(7)-type cytochrome triheme protein
MRALAILVLLAATAHSEPRVTAVGFDHLFHDQQIVVNGGEALACARCHVLAKGMLVGRPDHATCFGACHGKPPVAPRVGTKLALDADREKLCTACHAEAALVAPFSGRIAVPYPPYKIDPDFNLEISHKQHAKSTCLDCHIAPDTHAAKPAAHARCVACHDGTRAPAMDQCAGCHPKASGKPQPPELRPVIDSVATAFSHGKHAARAARGRECTTCHAAIAATDDTELPRPTTATCAACHDGKAAFATTEACNRCHPTEPEAFKVARPQKPFTHGGHHAAVVHDAPCGSCHPIVGNQVVVAGHAACARCHADDFGQRKPEICGACHNATEPWRPLTADREPAQRTELGVSLDHKKHAAACASCHSLRTETQQLRPPRGHVACATAGCHAVHGGPAPQLTACTGCHQLGLAAAREQARLAAPWSVRATFDHSAHALDRDGKPLACTACHVDLTAPGVMTLATPPKLTCAPCHDGAVAFKLTGITCKRCHPGGA